MKRPVGVIQSAVLLILGSLFHLLMALCMALSGDILQRQVRAGGFPGSHPPVALPGWMPGFMYAFCLFFVALAVWGILTAVGIMRLRHWARYSILVIGGLLAFFGFIYLLVMLLMMLVPSPVPSGVDASLAGSVQAVTRIFFGVFAILQGIVCTIGVFWLINFNRQKVREAFTNASGKALVSHRPILISVLAVLNLIGACFCLMYMFIPLPALLFGWILEGWGKVALYLFFAFLTASVGTGLWRLKQWGWWLALAMQAFGMVYCGVYLVRPSLMLHYTAEIQQRMVPMQPQLPERFHTTILSVSFGFAILLYIAIAAILIYYRKAFQRPAEQPPNESGVQL